MKNKLQAQGDVLLRPVKVLPQGDRQSKARDVQGRIVLAYGEVTGHAHAIHDPGVVAMMIGSRTFLDVEKQARVVHEEHAALIIEPGMYEVIQQREYVGENDWRVVAD